ncbi:MAG: TraM recognition domain-containing protein [Bacteroidota bacterium]
MSLPLMAFPDGTWTVRDAVEGVQIFGGIGSGKTTGSGRFLALKYLQAGFGGLVLTVKPTEKELWEEYAGLTGRSGDLLIVEPDGPHTFNFLEYESTHGDTANIVQVLKTVIRAGEEKASGVGQDPFWETALDGLIFHVIDLCKLAYDRVTVQDMYDIVQSLPTSEAQVAHRAKNSAFMKAIDAARATVDVVVDRWKQKQSPEALDQWARTDTYDAAVRDAVPEARLLGFVDQFFFETFMKLADRTRSIIDFSFSGFLFRLLRDPVYKLFCRGTSTFTPEDCFNGKIIVLNLPVKLHHKLGQDSQIMFKYIWQRAMEKRTIDEDSRPVFLWADEAQNFLHEYDAAYQATARSSMISTVYLSQNLPNYHANMGGAKSDFRVKSFLGTLATKFFHANADIETNRYASELIGDGFFLDKSSSKNVGREFSSGEGVHFKIDRIIRPEDFPVLKTGGERNGGKTIAYVHFQGNILTSGESFTKIQFDQNYQRPV